MEESQGRPPDCSGKGGPGYRLQPAVPLAAAAAPTLPHNDQSQNSGIRHWPQHSQVSDLSWSRSVHLVTVIPSWYTVFRYTGPPDGNRKAKLCQPAASWILLLSRTRYDPIGFHSYRNPGSSPKISGCSWKVYNLRVPSTFKFLYLHKVCRWITSALHPTPPHTGDPAHGYFCICLFKKKKKEKQAPIGILEADFQKVLGKGTMSEM